MKQQHFYIETYAKKLVDKGLFTPSIGLRDGKMGIAITLFHLHNMIQNSTYKNIANDLIDDVYKSLSEKTPYSFANGLFGIGSGIQYVINCEFVDGNSDEILCDVDAVARRIIDSREIKEDHLEEVVFGIAYYFYHRLNGKTRKQRINQSITLKNKEFLIYLIDWIEEILKASKNMKNFNDAYFLLCYLQQLNVFNSKVEKLMTLCLQKIIDFNIPISNNYELLGIIYLKPIKIWI